MLTPPEKRFPINLGTISDDGSMWYVDFNRDGDYADAGEAVVDNNGGHAPRIITANATFDEPGCCPTVMPMYENFGGEYMAMILGKGANLPLESMVFLDASPRSVQPFRQNCGTSAILLENADADRVFDSAADVHASFMGADSVFTISVLYGPTDGGRNEAAWAHSRPVGTFTDVASIQLDTTLHGLLPETRYYYTFLARNAAEERWAEPHSLTFVTPERPHQVSILSLQLGNPIWIESEGAEDWNVAAEYSADDLGQAVPMLWQPLSVLSDSFSNGVHTTSFAPLPEENSERYILRLRNVSPPP